MKKQLQYLLLTLLAGIFWVATSTKAVAQCPMCKAAVESNYGTENNPLADGLNTGILYLFILPYASIMLIGFIWYRGYRRKKKSQLEEEMAAEESQKLPNGLNPENTERDA